MTNWDDVHATNYETKAFWDIHWIRNADHLLESASLLKPKVAEVWGSYRALSSGQKKSLVVDHYQGPYFMLIAYALENLFKAAIVRQNSFEFKQQFRSDRKFPDQLKNHDLWELATQAKYKIEEGEEDLLRRLTRAAVWYGRYPVPLHYKKMSGTEQFSDGEEYSTSWLGGNDISRIDSLVNNIRRWLNVAHSD